jgi:phage protein D
MDKARSVTLAVNYNNQPFGGEVGEDIESMTYVDSAADNSDSIEITLNAQDDKWLHGWMPEKGATLRPIIRGHDWNGPGDNHAMECGLFVLDDIGYNDTPTTLKLGGVSKPSDTNFSELEREYVWKNTSIKRIGETIAARYGLSFGYDAEDYGIECDEQDGTDSSYYNTLCKNYGLILKVYAKRLWVYDREAYKSKRAVQDFDRTQIKRGSLSYTTTLSGTYTGGFFDYTDPDKDCDISCSVGSGTHTKSVNRRATSVYDASVQLCAEINAANHGTIKLSFSVQGNFMVAAGNNIRLTGYGTGLTGAINGKYFVDKVTHKVSRSGGFETSFDCSGIRDPFHHWEVGGTIEYKQAADESGVQYTSTYETTSPAANAASSAAGAVAGGAVTLTKAPFYYTSVVASPSCYKSGTFYFYDGILINGRYRITNSAARCGKLPVGQNVTGWVPASYCTGAK